MRYAIGIDSGSTTTKAVFMRNGETKFSKVCLTGVNSETSAVRLINEIKESHGITNDEVGVTVVTGYGRDSISIGNKKVTEIVCIAKGAYSLCPGVEVVIDIGGQDSKGIKVGAAGKVVDFIMNDKCAAGTGRFLDVMSRLMEVDINEAGPISLKSDNPANISNTCTIFAESEVISHVAKGTPVEDILAGLHEAIAGRVYGLCSRILAGANQIMFTGGVGQNQGIEKYLEKKLGTILIKPEFPQIVGAIGAALIGQELLNKGGAHD